MLKTKSGVRDFFNIFLVAIFFCYFVYDVESVFDLTDMYGLYFIGFLFSFVCLFINSYCRGLVLKVPELDVFTWLYVYSYMFNLVTYILIIFVVFFVHILTPYSINNFSEVFAFVKVMDSFFFFINVTFLIFVVWEFLSFVYLAKASNGRFLLKFLIIFSFIMLFVSISVLCVIIDGLYSYAYFLSKNYFSPTSSLNYKTIKIFYDWSLSNNINFNVVFLSTSIFFILVMFVLLIVLWLLVFSCLVFIYFRKVNKSVFNRNLKLFNYLFTQALIITLILLAFFFVLVFGHWDTLCGLL